MALAENFSRNLKLQRQHRHLTQQELASEAGLSVAYISMLKRGQRSPPLDTLEQLAKALAVAPVALLVRSGSGRRSPAGRK